MTSDMQPHFDLGIATSVEKLKVRPSGNIELFPVSGVDQFLTLTEGQGQPFSAVAANGETP